MEIYPNNTTLFDQSFIYHHHPYYPIDILFEKQLESSCLFMDPFSTLNPDHHQYNDNNGTSKSVNIPIIIATETSTSTSSSSSSTTTYNSNIPTSKRRRTDTLTSTSKRRHSHHHHHHHQQQQEEVLLNYNKKDIGQFQDTLDYLQDEWATIDIVLQSLKSAFTIHPSKMSTEEYLDEVDRELSIAYDDLMAQVRSLDRNLKRLDVKIKSYTTSSGPLASRY
ncbi:uncharacterized protein BX664DRAFT_313369 [Halteromyces radiatus]|uniref:uncharacterized protein n=1 Tax=Halteromyces radiatus TaxID=101107 RepID=UPI00221F875A|nr:uncharacterized protein BX664DRAFT_313369 [Halteromyces radiatus]KAI8093302.1 hypothetical protein BX664DRAFT_313369 [Halteromyces radiatus]